MRSTAHGRICRVFSRARAQVLFASLNYNGSPDCLSGCKISWFEFYPDWWAATATAILPNFKTVSFHFLGSRMSVLRQGS